MRMATLSHLIAAEDLADTAVAAAGGKPYGARLADTDLDAIDEILVTTPGQTIIIDTADGAGISSWDLRASRMALNSVLRRRPEAYHERLVAHEQAAEEAAIGGTETEALAEAPKTIHDIVSTKEPGLAAFLHYDRHERRSGLVHLFPADGSTNIGQLEHSTYLELGDFVEGAYERVSIADDRLVLRRLGRFDLDGIDRQLSVTKTYAFGADRLRPELQLEVAVGNASDTPLAFELAVEWNVNLLGGGHNPTAYYETESGERTPHDVAGEMPAASLIAFGNDYEGIRIEARPSPTARLTWLPVETVSNSEGGFERVYQGSSLLFRWPVSLAAGERRTVTVSFGVTQSIDHSAAEAEAE